MIIYPVQATTYGLGGKAAGLLKLKEAGVRVPDFLVIPAENFDAVIHSAGSSMEDIRKGLSSYHLTERDKQTIKRILSGWNFPRTRVVVRSSIADEDGSRHAFAGLMETFMNLTTWEDMYHCIAACAASAYSPVAMEYRRQGGLPMHPRPAVVVQQQVDARVSGVVFSTFPEYPREMAIHALWGLGEGLVSGRFQPDEFYLSKKDGTLVRTSIADKQKEVTTTGSQGTAEKEVGAEERGIACLQEGELAHLYQIATGIERAFDHPQDMEFVIKDGQIWMVQSRPITQPIPEVVVYDNSNIQESYCGVTTPLTFSFARRAYATVYRQTMNVLALSSQVVQAHETVVNNLLGSIKGRVYYNINNWYKGLLLLPSFRQNKEDMERMMGLQEPVDFVEGTSKTMGEKLRMLPSLAINLLRLLRAFKKLPTTIPAFHLHFSQQYNRFYQLAPERLTGPELIEQKKVLDKELLNNWTTPIINDFYVMMTHGKVNRKLKKAGIGDVQSFLSVYLSADNHIASVQPAIVLQKLAEKAGANSSLRNLITTSPDPHAELQQASPDFYKEVTRFIEAYGDRTVGELKLETITMRVDPAIFYKYLNNFLGTHTTPAASHSLKEGAGKELEEKLSARSARFRKGVYKSLIKLQTAIRYREALRLERTRLFGMYRSLYLAAGRQLCLGRALGEERDVFYLTEEEMEALLVEPKDARALVEERKKEYKGYEQEDVPSRVIIPSPPAVPVNNDPEDPYRLQGTGCYPGIITGEALVVTGPGDDLRVNGKIVCALRTDPGWASLFPTCKAVLIEKGSALSHSVILLREFGIPAIINIPGLTRKIRSGQRLTINGTTGEIQLEADETNR